MTLMLSETPSITRLSEEALVCLCRRNMPYMLVIEERGRPVRLEPKATETEAMAELVRILSAPGAKGRFVMASVRPRGR